MMRHSGSLTAAEALAAISTGVLPQAPATYRVTPDTFWNTLDHRHAVVQRI